MSSFSLQIDLQPEKPPAETTVVVAMSGGVDSSVAAARLVEAGYNVVGVMMRLWSEEAPGQSRENRCCTIESTNDARRIATQLGIPFYLINVEEVFRRKVVDPFIAAYSAGRTPNPCVACNRSIRFDYLLNYARALDADYLATGHYARVRVTAQGYELLRGVDRHKDQSYVLSVLDQENLPHVCFPVGDLAKPQVREMAAAYGLDVASQAESMDLCFIADGDYRRFLRDWAGEAVRPGPIRHVDGRILGEHQGLPFYTIGQRKGLGLSSPEKLFVVQLDTASNSLIVGPASSLGRDRFTVQQINWVSGRAPAGPQEYSVKIRYRAQDVPATVIPGPDNTATVQLRTPLRDITPGQIAVFYDDERCLGGGEIQ